MQKNDRPSTEGHRGRRVGTSAACAAVMATVLVLALCAGCGGAKKSTSDQPGNPNYEARQAITDALESERALDESARNLMEMVKAGQYDINRALDDFVDQNKSLLGIISTVSAVPKPPNPKLAAVQASLGEYLRNRVHQLEGTLSATTAAELETLYNQPVAQLQAERKQIVDALLAYDPGLKDTVK